MSCSNILSVCVDNYLQETEERLLQQIVVDEDLKGNLESCQKLKHLPSLHSIKQINKRSPVAKKRGGSRRGGGGLSSRARGAFSGGAVRKGQKALGTILNNRKSKFGSATKFAGGGIKRKGGFLRKAGKYAVVGLAGKWIPCLCVHFIVMK